MVDRWTLIARPKHRRPILCRTQGHRFRQETGGALSVHNASTTDPRKCQTVTIPRQSRGFPFLDDDGEKRINYQSLPSLDEYLLLDPDTGEGTLYRRGGAFWTRIQVDRPDSPELRSVGLRGTMAWLLGVGP
jgi:hypothetical protein